MNTQPISDTMTKTEYKPHGDDAFMADTLLPCPCCGGKPKLTFIGNPHTKTRKVNIKCGDCRLERNDVTMRYDAEWMATHSINHWNKRKGL